MKKHIKAELLMLKQNGLATQNYKQKLNRLIDSPTITFDDWRKTGTFCNGSDISKMYNLGTLSTHVVRYAGGIVIECDHLYKDEKKPKIFENSNSEKGAEITEPEMFEEPNLEEDFEIPAFLRKQKN